VSAEYRLAPQHPFPAPLDDCLAAWDWLVASGRAGERRLAVGGQSAGGGLAAALAQRVRDERVVQPTAQWLFCPMLDDRTAAFAGFDTARHFLWDNRSNRAGWAAYLAQAPGAAVVPAYAVPARRENLTGLPATWIGTGTAELFHAEDVAYARALAEAGVEVTLDEVPGAPHAFERLAARTPVARDYLARSFSWLGERLAP
jgi:acetyl esterase/lipase